MLSAKRLLPRVARLERLERGGEDLQPGVMSKGAIDEERAEKVGTRIASRSPDDTAQMRTFNRTDVAHAVE